MTMDSLVFVRFVERTMQPLALAELKQRRGADAVESLDFDQRGARAAAPWFTDMYRALKHHQHLDDLGVPTGGDPLASSLAEGHVHEDGDDASR